MPADGMRAAIEGSRHVHWAAQILGYINHPACLKGVSASMKRSFAFEG
jgi:hypothetical protein